MDFADILKFFSAILIPIILITSRQSQKAKQEYDNKYKRTSVNTQRAQGQSPTVSTRDYVPHWEKTENTSEMQDKKNNNHGYTIPEVSLESHNYNEEDHIKKEQSLESSEYFSDSRKDNYRATISFRKDQIMDTIGDREIGSENLNLNFETSQLIQGIVMSEILSKPKSLKK